MAQSIKQEARAAIISACEREIAHLEADVEEDARDKRLPKVIAEMKRELEEWMGSFAHRHPQGVE